MLRLQFYASANALSFMVHFQIFVGDLFFGADKKQTQQSIKTKNIIMLLLVCD